MRREAPSMYGRTVPLDPAVHRHRKISPLTDFSIAAKLHAVFITATEFAQAALEFPIVFVDSGPRDAAGRPVMSPVALLGLGPGENLHVEGGRWTARYVPAFIRRYPFLTAKVQGSPATHVLVDDTWSGFSDDAAEPLFLAGDAPAPALQRTMDFLERFELESERTRLFCERLVSLGVLKEMKADATLPSGETALGRRLPRHRRRQAARAARSARARALAQRFADADAGAPDLARQHPPSRPAQGGAAAP